MNKTVTVNIGGMVFHIEELAYDKLKNYLQTIRSHFSVSDGRDEIIEDIESRIAEILLQILGKSRQVVTSEDVDQVMSVMGKPEDFAGADDAAGSTSQTTGDA
ncbi:MAG: PspC family transcriptional regulator, partial [Bacteroidetes bacterium]|nr:PspC family transcriptional regulator [Bacteroidota bacterium]